MSKRCFVLMPFASTFDGIWQEVLRPAVTSIGHTCTRADDFMQPGIIIDDILKSIATADYLIADLSGRNPNVYYELGIAHALKKPVVLIAQKIDEVPFDLRHHRIHVYDDTAKGAANLRRSIEVTIRTL